MPKKMKMKSMKGLVSRGRGTMAGEMNEMARIADGAMGLEGRPTGNITNMAKSGAASNRGEPIMREQTERGEYK